MSKLNIMIVDDDQALLEFLEKAVAVLGHKAQTASSGLEALKKISQVDDSVDILLTDIVMPKMTGFELADRFRTASPNSKIVFMCGFKPRFLGIDPEKVAEMNFLQKPFSIEELEEILINA